MSKRGRVSHGESHYLALVLDLEEAQIVVDALEAINPDEGKAQMIALGLSNEIRWHLKAIRE